MNQCSGSPSANPSLLIINFSVWCRHKKDILKWLNDYTGQGVWQATYLPSGHQTVIHINDDDVAAALFKLTFSSLANR
jgi:hypothetical protein